MDKEFFKAVTLKEGTLRGGELKRDKTITNEQYNKFCFFMNGVGMLERAITKRAMERIEEEKGEEEMNEDFKKKGSDEQNEDNDNDNGRLVGFDQEELFKGNKYLLGEKFTSATGGVLNTYLKHDRHAKNYENDNNKKLQKKSASNGTSENTDCFSIPLQRGNYSSYTSDRMLLMDNFQNNNDLEKANVMISLEEFVWTYLRKIGALLFKLELFCYLFKAYSMNLILQIL